MSTESVKLDLTPDTHMLFGQANASLGWKKCIGELIDNAFDAGACSVHVEHSKKTMTVMDDGKGCGDISAFFRLGTHKSKGGLGVYGVGLKDAATWLGGTTEVHTTQRGRKRTAIVNWTSLANSGNWSIDSFESDTPDADGTMIRFSNIQRILNNRDALLEELSYIFSPAISSQGRQIVFRSGGKRHPIQPWKMPPLDYVVDAESEIDGKRFRVYAGMVQEGHKNTKPGFSIAYRHRIITNTAEGCGELGTARFCGMVHLDDSWHLQLGRNKDELVEDGGLLAEVLYRLCESPLRQASQQAVSVELAGLEKEVSEALEHAMSDHIKSKRNTEPKTSGTVKKKGTPRKQRNAPVSQSGEKRLLTKIGRKIQVQFVDGLKQIGKVDFSDAVTLISLSSDEPYVQWARDSKDANSLTALAASILAIEASAIEDEQQRHRLLPEIDDDAICSRFLAGLSLYTRHIQSKDAVS